VRRFKYIISILICIVLMLITVGIIYSLFLPGLLDGRKPDDQIRVR